MSTPQRWALVALLNLWSDKGSIILLVGKNRFKSNMSLGFTQRHARLSKYSTSSSVTLSIYYEKIWFICQNYDTGKMKGYTTIKCSFFLGCSCLMLDHCPHHLLVLLAQHSIKQNNFQPSRNPCLILIVSVAKIPISVSFSFTLNVFRLLNS